MTCKRALQAAVGGVGLCALVVSYAYRGIVVRWPRDSPNPQYTAQAVQGQVAPTPPPSAKWSDPKPGEYYVGSPNGRYLAFARTTRRAYHTVFVWDEKTRTLHPVVSVQEGDPGSGASHEYRWSTDSRALFISGWGALPFQGVENPLSYVYVVEEDALYRVPKYGRID